ncbi:Profilin/allergen [Coemansia reversa NRRL 1564]|uniref:Profilin n=1 Tax=Coemansia reversa (strain ATCC 12441 / NRRL 1564) TaxID=763665 RepID=A0A2G5BEN1_COERN|nr:Profilin/allergen [Coemansia reversa NRRL 1564]|eukprot:PIA17468.1 Profilin/allergen [Coemansia reversa NRRL 1564]
MSWNQYVDNIMKIPGVTSVAILGKDTKVLSVWARSKDFSNDNARVLKLVQDLPKFDVLQASGISLVEGFKYMTTVANESFVHARKENQGVFAFDFNSGYVVLTYAPGVDAGNVSNAVDVYIKHLRTQFPKAKTA